MINAEAKFESWKNKLLDLGKNNKLLHCSPSSNANLFLEQPNCAELWESFVQRGAPLVFPLPSEEGEFDERQSDLKTNKTPKEYQKILRALRSKAKIAMEEQGVNVLFLAFGFLHWTDPEKSDQSFSSPLVLAPVSLMLESINSPFVLRMREDEIVLNPTLSYKFKNDFGIQLPEFDQTKSINEILSEVEKITQFRNWSVTSEVGLNLFPFYKINLYEDFNRQKESILTNPIVRAIMGDASAIPKIPEEFSCFNFDRNEKPESVYQVLDADASQQEAILLAKKGVSFVLQGPPGTGKSQTITNIIAESLAEGKKVLFVSEKMAALDVVHRRLAQVGLEDFSLVLHSQKANKKAVLEQLNKVLNLPRQEDPLTDEAFLKLTILQQDKEKLNDYAKQLHTPVLPLQKTIYEVNGILANLESYDEYVFGLDDVSAVSCEEYNRYLSLITQLKRTLGERTDDYKTNPWKDCALSSVSYEFRHDASSRLHTILPALEELDSAFGIVLETLRLDCPRTFNNLELLIQTLELAIKARKAPCEWVLSDLDQPFESQVEEFEAMKNSLVLCKKQFDEEYSALLQSEETVPKISLDAFSLPSIQEVTQSLSSYLNDTAPYLHWLKNDDSKITTTLFVAKKVADKVKNLKNKLLQIYEPTVFELDHRTIYGRIKTEYTSFTKYFKKSYRQDKKAIRLQRKDFVKKVRDEEMRYLVKTLKKIEEEESWFSLNAPVINEIFGEGFLSSSSDFYALERQLNSYQSIKRLLGFLNQMNEIHQFVLKKEETMKKRCQFLYQGISTDWKSMKITLEWSFSMKSALRKIHAEESFVKAVCEGGSILSLCKKAKDELVCLKEKITPDYLWLINHFESPESFHSVEFETLKERFRACLNGFSLLEEWIDLREARKNCVDAGLEDFIRIIDEHSIPSSALVPIFQKRFFRLWLDAVLPNYFAARNFRKNTQKSTVEEFCQLDRFQFALASKRIQAKLLQTIPSIYDCQNGDEEISLLRRELGKQRKILPLRQLFQKIPRLLLTLKPCLMMSPLSVSLFLEAETYQFDLVIFDEASQVRPEDAIGAISRAKQVIIAGDSKQLPPTNFFQTTLSEESYDADSGENPLEESNAYESILDEAALLPACSLKWHYRSRHERLISFSNEKFYQNQLITFPSNEEQNSVNGVEYLYAPDGFYDRGGKKGNLVEANIVADLVFQHFQESPNRSLGVIAFGEVQQQAIEKAIRERRLLHQEYEPFFAEDRAEPFFIKNLENVQGDERDNVIFSVGYAKDQEGVFRMNFGPLSMIGGERRLNVAITRAKYHVTVVGSILPQEIDLNKITSEGPKLLRSYIEFAQNLSSAKEEKDTTIRAETNRTAFEDAVCSYLELNGYQVKRRVGCYNYKIDVAVEHPTKKGVYVLGIECDGATYRAARTARERDRLRDEVLRNMGWQTYRVWSTDWIKDPVVAGVNLIEAVKNAISIFDTFEGKNDDSANEETRTIVPLNEAHPKRRE